MKTLPKISIVTPTFNQGVYIEETIQSIVSQRYPNLEYIIIDGGSTDNTASIIKKYKSYLSYWVSEPDRGQAHAINKGLKHCQGDIIGWLNSDDILMPNTLFQIANNFPSLQKPALLSGSGIYFNSQGIVWQPTETEQEPHEKKYTKAMLLQCWKHSLHQPSTYWNRTLMEEVGLLNEDIYFAMDLEYWLRIIDKDIPIYLWSKPLSQFRLHDHSKSVAENDRLQQDLLYLSEKHLSKAEHKVYLSQYDAHYGCYLPAKQIIQNAISEKRLIVWWQAWKAHPFSVIESPHLMLSALYHALFK